MTSPMNVTVAQKNYAAPANRREPLLKSEEAGQFLALSPGWLAKLRMTGGGPRFIKLGRRVRYARSDLDAWIAAGHSASTSDHKAAGKSLQP